MRDQRERLRDILDSIVQIEKYAAQGKQAFEQNELIQVWMLHHIEIIGEACRALQQPFKKKYSEVPWKQIVDMRTILVHQYFFVDKDEVCAAVEKDIPDLKPKIEAILQSLGGTP